MAGCHAWGTRAPGRRRMQTGDTDMDDQDRTDDGDGPPDPKDDRDGPPAAGGPEGGEGAGGLRWLKYTGIGGRGKSGPAGPGLTGPAITSLGSLEAEVLGVLWEIGHPATGMEVMERSLYKRRARGEEPTAFATIATTLRRLTQKGLLTAEKNAQRTPVYAPTVGREEMAARVLNNVSETLLGRPLHALLPRLAGALPPGPAESPSPEGASLPQLLQALHDLAGQEGQGAAGAEEGRGAARTGAPEDVRRGDDRGGDA